MSPELLAWSVISLVKKRRGPTWGGKDPGVEELPRVSAFDESRRGNVLLVGKIVSPAATKSLLNC